MGMPHLYASPAAVMAGIPALWFQLGLPDPHRKLDRLIALLPARGILACSHTVAEAQARQRPRHPTRAVHLGVELDRFDPGRLPTPREARLRLGLPPEGPLIGIVGRMQRWKGMHTLIEAMPAILRVHPDAHAVIVGGEHALEPDYPAHLRSRVDTLDLCRRVIFTGLQRNVPEWMQAMDVIVHASACEPFGIVVVEAMALGKPVVAGADGGPTEVITEGVDGLFAPYDDVEALASAILRYLDAPDFARSVGTEAARRASQFSARHFVHATVTAIRDLLENKPI
jgi:glycosyltransferase involved in cell wall biosynthesis